MPSAQDCAEKLREQAYKTLLPQIRNLEEELKTLGSSLSAGVHQIERKLDALRQVELPTTKLILDEILGEVIRQKDLETSTLARFTRELGKKETQEEILSFLLDEAQKYSPRLALFAVRGDRWVGWSSRGCSDDLARAIGSDSFPRSECPQLSSALEGEDVVTASALPEQECLQSLQEAGRGPWHLFPLRVLNRPVALLLACGTEEMANPPSALSILMDFTALRLENIALKILNELMAEKPKPAIPHAPAESAAAPAHVAAPERSAEMPAAQPAFEQEPAEAPIPAAPTPSYEAEPVPELVPAGEAAGEEFDGWTGTQTQIPIVIPALQPEIPEAPQPEAQPGPGEEKLHADAKRFARLLVSEIKLYNEHHVVEGRQNRDLYLRLKKDIDRSREMYEKRVSPNVSRKIDYFHDEIIRILGDNDPSKLGSDYPGPRVES
jgi:hypothetical protein